ncbi:MAG: phosphopyruvate hydratase [Candidatus Kerfeldbacteria bacterium CG_4_10_14_0_8_um_filter_42_10]|uniref:Enolase n=1 Tax=Candidatus Kerfeldbacteria bacterium CG_4_10_14_0_8_um_filter_42_10 TaxID=2014248 RepID=A0A2M7RH61_9BACT|nr:MAG: phosphopyruvate hydratase [Candidatus Kerfeldbacteria bacterium CG_4_10_14_0_8_um_filter_42_10]
MSKIKKIQALEILDSRGNPTIEVKVTTDNGACGITSIPSGASTGTYEALELRDGDPNRYFGKGTLKAVENVSTKLAPAIIGMAVEKQQEIDQKMIELDGTENKAKLGANAILGVSLACAKAAAASQRAPLYQYLRSLTSLEGEYQFPLPMMNVINGGKHADSGLDIQEFMIVPQAAEFKERIRMGVEIFHSLKNVLETKNLPTSVGDEGGFAPRLTSHKEAMDLILLAVSKTNYTVGSDVSLALDSAASEFYKSEHKKYFLQLEKLSLSSEEMIKMYQDWLANYPIISLEDGLSEDDWDGWVKLTAKLKDKIQLVGDDLFVTNIERLKKGIDQSMANAILIKLNQIGTLTETLKCIQVAKDNNYRIVISHRSGETADTVISDLSVAVNAEYIKTGSLSRGERVVKYNRLMEIENELRMMNG